ncbi:Gag-Pol polyprotein [Pseudohyphozyma bogoriensis]|nr:Gag-Pol polyprotein [Pseudohyphozyma bogoriensis]
MASNDSTSSRVHSDARASSSLSQSAAATSSLPAPPGAHRWTAPPSGASLRPLGKKDRLRTKDQWTAWKRQVDFAAKAMGRSGRALLDGEGRPASPEAADIFDALDYTISSFLVLSIDPSINYLVDGKETTADIISALREHFAPSSAQGAVSLLKHLFTLRLASTSLPSIDTFIKDFRDTTSTLERDGLCIGTIQLSVLLLSIMEQHSSLKTLATTLTVSAHSAATLPSPEDILSRLRDEGRPDQHVVVGHLAASSTSRARGPPPGPCFTPGCGQPHWLDECQHPGADATRAERKRQRDEKSRRRGKAKSANSAEASTPAPTGPSSSAPSASLATLLGDDYGGGVAAWNSTLAPKDRSRSADYKLDSGATHHMSGDRQHFSSFVTCTPEPVHGIGGSLFATGLGQVAFIAQLEGGRKQLVEMKQVLLVKNISSNLVLSNRQLDPQGECENNP